MEMTDPTFINAVKWSTERLNDADNKPKSFFFSLPFLFVGVIVLVVIAVIVLWWFGRKRTEKETPQSDQNAHQPDEQARQQAPQQSVKRVVKKVVAARPRSPVEQVEYVDEDGNKIDPSKVRA